jgi:RHS repeat-associated protein
MMELAYDAWGRMTSKAISGSYSATYAYRYGDKLYSVASDFPGEGTVTYEYGGDQKRRERSVSGGDYTWYNWDVGFNVINRENANGTLARSYLLRNQAHIDGTSPTTGDWKYYTHDNLGSTRRVWNENKTAYAVFEYSPYGEVYASSGAASEVTRLYTGHDWDDASRLYYAMFRYYSPATARWLARDPLGMVAGPNVYGYVRGRPTVAIDPEGAVALLLLAAIAALIAAGVIAAGIKGRQLWECAKAYGELADLALAIRKKQESQDFMDEADRWCDAQDAKRTTGGKIDAPDTSPFTPEEYQILIDSDAWRRTVKYCGEAAAAMITGPLPNGSELVPTPPIGGKEDEGE